MKRFIALLVLLLVGAGVFAAPHGVLDRAGIGRDRSAADPPRLRLLDAGRDVERARHGRPPEPRRLPRRIGAGEPGPGTRGRAPARRGRRLRDVRRGTARCGSARRRRRSVRRRGDGRRRHRRRSVPAPHRTRSEERHRVVGLPLVAPGERGVAVRHRARCRCRPARATRRGPGRDRERRRRRRAGFRRPPPRGRTGVGRRHGGRRERPGRKRAAHPRSRRAVRREARCEPRRRRVRQGVGQGRQTRRRARRGI